MIEVTIQHSKDDIREAIVQFCARRGYRLTNPWYLEGVRIEIPNRIREAIEKRGFWATVMDVQTVPRVDVDVKRRRARSSRVKISVGDHADSVRLAYELQAYLNDDRAYEPECPPVCPSCGSNVANPMARYCGRCGHRFAKGKADDGRDDVLRPPPVVAYEKSAPPIEHALDVVADEAATPETPNEVAEDAQPTSVIVERDAAPASGEVAEASEAVVDGAPMTSAPEMDADDIRDEAPIAAAEAIDLEEDEGTSEAAPENDGVVSESDEDDADTSIPDSPPRRLLAEE
ncbi:MAG TPA: hypothetical protein P5081_00295 [Phycisphaerae bacterium]|nr:hypothetical protein [Phycisphaerae bacterium]HRW51292.1 hypothetical protein [Phycisphaerae bacterium]